MYYKFVFNFVLINKNCNYLNYQNYSIYFFITVLQSLDIVSVQKGFKLKKFFKLNNYKEAIPNF